MTTAEKFVTDLAHGVFAHAALRNDFYRLWMGQALDFGGVAVFARNYLARTVNTSTMVALSLLSTDDVRAKTEIAKNLHSEFGYGNPDKAHISLLRGFLASLLTRLRGAPVELALLERMPLLPTTARFIARQRELYTRPDAASVLGTLLAQEWLAYSMLTRLYEGARNYMPLFRDIDEFHEHCEYFYVHIGDAEKAHKEQAIRSAAIICGDDPAARERVREGFNGFLEITAAYWAGIHDAIVGRRAEAA
ncbi:MAG: iron-containing redox enzyme family protein [Alphaproteobacteria bacterium]|nr:iron-containing redox enzyme family protein [Alphaproteobacteria bacterium]